MSVFEITRDYGSKIEIFESSGENLFSIPPLNCQASKGCSRMYSIPIPGFIFTSKGASLEKYFQSLWQKHLKTSEKHIHRIMLLMDEGKEEEIDDVEIPGILTIDEFQQHAKEIRVALSLPENFPILPKARLLPERVVYIEDATPPILIFDDSCLLRSDVAKNIQQKNWEGVRLYETPIMGSNDGRVNYFELFSSFVGKVNSSLRMIADMTRCPGCGFNVQRSLPGNLETHSVIPTAPVFYLEDFHGIFVTEEFKELIEKFDNSPIIFHDLEED